MRNLVAAAEPKYQIRAQYTDSTVTVYRRAGDRSPDGPGGRFPAVWQWDRMTWIIKQRDPIRSPVP
ncbi:hypothetical protein [Streptomyces sp. NPDC127066]|uniref:hypothetical protein n=1 Tax=Streptomyces sp. NPDC127066 TaxID=3347125 RepID=UPI00365147AB